MGTRVKVFVAVLVGAMFLIPSLASARRTLLLDQQRFSGVDYQNTTTDNTTGNLLAVRVTNSGMTFIEDLVNGILQDPIMTNYIDCYMRQMLDGNVQVTTCGSESDLSCTPMGTPDEVSCPAAGNYQYSAGYQGDVLFNSCAMGGDIEIPMVGAICVAARLANIDQPTDARLINFRQIAGQTPVLRFRALDKTTPHTENDSLDVLVKIEDMEVDIKIEPPYGLTDIYNVHSDGSPYAGYEASRDYSSYVKAWGRVGIPQVQFSLSMRSLMRYNDYAGDPLKHPHLRDVGMDLFGFYMDLGLEYVIVPGPYCNDHTEDGAYAFNWSTKCSCPCGDCIPPYTAKCPPPNVEGIVLDTQGETTGCSRANIDATWPGDKANTNCDDPVLPNSEMIADVVPFIDLQLTALAENVFSGNQGWPYLDWYIGPTRIMSLNPILECLSIDHPMTIETDLIMLNLGMNSEFWADSVGLIIPLDFGLDFQYYEDPDGDDKNFTAMTSCVEVWGFSEPITSQSIGACAPNADCEFINYGDEDQLGGGQMWFTGPCDSGTFCDGTPDKDNYHIGIGVHQNMLSTVIYDAVTTGLLCMWLDKATMARSIDGLMAAAGGAMPDIESMLGPLSGLLSMFSGASATNGLDFEALFGALFTTDIFGLMMPDLALAWPGADMAIEVIPMVTYPRAEHTRVGFGPLEGPAPIAGYASPVTNEPPYVKTGTLQVDWQYFVPGAAPGSQVRYHGPVTTYDMVMVMPHTVVNFYVYDDSTSIGDFVFSDEYRTSGQVDTGTGLYQPETGKRYSQTPMGAPLRVFGLDTGATIGVDLNILNLASAEYEKIDFTTNVGWPRTDLGSGYHQDGAGWNADTRRWKFPVYTYPGGIEFRTGRVIDMTAIVDNQLRHYLEYYEAIDDWDPLNPATTYPDFFEDVLGNILPVMLSSLAMVDLSLGLDIGRVMDTPFTINGVGGPDGDDPVATPGYHDNAGIFAAGPNHDNSYTVPTFPAGNIGLANGDWLGIFIELQGEMSASAALTMMEPFMAMAQDPNALQNLLGGLTGGMASGETMEILNINVNDLMGAVGAALGGLGAFVGLGTPPPCAGGTVIDDDPVSFSPCSPFSPSYWTVMDNYYPPETNIHEPSVVDARGTLITFDAYDEKDTNGQIRFSYRLDHGVWSPWSTKRFAVVKGLLEGAHLFDVRALDSDGNLEPTPARLIFQVDSVPPRVALSGTVRGSAADFVAEVQDFQSKPESIQVAYRLDDSSWSEYQFSKTISLAHLSDGAHTLSVKALDEAGNEAIATQAFNIAPEAAFGCSTVPTTQGGAALLLLLVPGLIVLRRRMGR